MESKPTYDELVLKVQELERKVAEALKVEISLMESEKKLKVSEERSRTWLEHSPVCTKIVDLDFNLQYMSSAGIKSLHVDDITQFYGKPYPFDFYPESFKKPMASNLEKVKSTGEVITQEASVVDLDGNELWFHSTLVPVKDDGRIDYIIVVSLDTTERKKAERELAKHREHLELLVEDRTLKLKEAQAELIQGERLATLGSLTATVSHELRNPLGTIQTALFSIADSLERNDSSQVARTLELADRSISRCVTIIEELNSYARIKDLVLSETSVDDWLRTVFKEQSIPEEIFCELDLSSGVRASFDHEKLRQVVVNLIANAVHALQDKQSNGNHLRVSTHPLDNKYEIRISDNGIGMTSDIKEKVFEPLFSTKGFGVGLGMVIVKNIVDQHHGEINIESKEGEGTTVTLRLPINPSGERKSQTI
jgi:PAS domain S-box-containing protein